MIKGVLFDIDGTLLLSNDAHAHAWEEAFAEYGYEIDYDAIRRLIGIGGDKLISSLRPELTDAEGDGKKIKEKHRQIFLQKYIPHLQSAPGSRELVQGLQSRGLKTIAASSASHEELQQTLEAAEVKDLLTQATSSDDAAKSKPDPDIVHAALEVIKLSPDEVVMIGDTPYDIAAAQKAGVRCVAVRCGGWQDKDLQAATGVYSDPSDILQHIDEVLNEEDA